MGEVVSLAVPQKSEIIHPILYAKDLTLGEFKKGDIGQYLFSATVLVRTPDVSVYELTHLTTLAATGNHISLASFVREDEATFGQMERLIFDIVNGVVVDPDSAAHTNKSDIYLNYELTQQIIADLVQGYMRGKNGKRLVLLGGSIKDTVFLDVPHSAYEATNLPKEKLSFARKGRSVRIVFH